MLIYIVDDEEHIRELISYNLQKEGYEVVMFESGIELIEMAEKKQPDLLILDIMMPKMSGLEVCSRLRSTEKTKDIPMMFLTAKNSEFDKVLGFEIGADDYITKPFSVRELVSRVKALLRRNARGQMPIAETEVGGIKIDTDSRKVFVNGEEISCTFKEFELLKILMENKGKVLSREVLLDKIWGYDFVGETRTVDVHIRNLRKALGENGDKQIETSRGIGYRFKG